LEYFNESSRQDLLPERFGELPINIRMSILISIARIFLLPKNDIYICLSVGNMRRYQREYPDIISSELVSTLALTAVSRLPP